MASCDTRFMSDYDLTSPATEVRPGYAAGDRSSSSFPPRGTILSAPSASRRLQRQGPFVLSQSRFVTLSRLHIPSSQLWYPGSNFLISPCKWSATAENNCAAGAPVKLPISLGAKLSFNSLPSAAMK